MAQRTKGPRFYTTEKSAQQFVNEIMVLLQEFGADSFHVQQQGGEPAAVAFVAGGVAHRMRPNVEGVRRRLGESKGGSPSKAAAVAWAQQRHLLELQLEAVESEVASAGTILGGYVLTSGSRTVGEMIEERAGELLPGETPLLPSPDG